MKTPLPFSLLLILPLALAIGCARSEADTAQTTDAAPETSFLFQEIESPAAPGSGLPNFFVTPGGTVLLSWVEPGAEKKTALRFARLDGDAWTTPQTIAEGNDWFVNWADFPSIVALGENALAAHLLVKSGPDTYAYDVQITQSQDGGQTWSPAVKPHRDGTLSEHGFVAMLPWHDGRLLAAWLDGRNTGGGHDGHGGGAMTLRAATLGPDGTLADEVELDGRVCDCCQTSAARTAHGAVVAYRDRSDQEIRDISIVRLDENGWSAPRTVHEDGWEIAGCPVNGPAVAAGGARVAVAWFTAAGETPHVRVAFSEDEGHTFGPAITVNDDEPIGRVDVALLPDGGALISWVEKTPSGAAIRIRVIHADGTREAAATVAPTSPKRASGFPQLTRHGNYIYIAWTDAATDALQVHTAVATL